MRIDQLEALVEISRCNSLSMAGEHLHITVQALSASIKSLEQEMNTILLERNSKGVILTKSGLELVNISKRFLSEIQEIKYKQKDPRIVLLKKPVTFYVQEALYELFIPKFFCEFKKRMPDVEITIEKRDTTEDLLDCVLNTETEFAFMFWNLNNQRHEHIIFHELFECKLACIAHENFAISSRKTTSLSSLSQYPVSIYFHGDSNRSKVLELLKNSGAKNVVIERDQCIHREMLESGLAIGISIMTPFENYKRPYSKSVKNILINDDIPIKGGYITEKNKNLSEQSQIVLKYLQNYLQGHGYIFPSCAY